MTKFLAVLVSVSLFAGPAQAQIKIAPVEVSPLGMAPASFNSAPALLPASLPSALSLAPALTAPSLEVQAAPALAAAALPASAVALSAAPVASAVSPAAPVSAAKPKSAVATLAAAVTAGISKTVTALFDGARSARDETAPAFAQAMIAPSQEEHSLKPGVRLDAKPRPSDAGAVKVSHFHLTHDREPAGRAPTKLDADPRDPASIEKALRDLVDANPAKYGAGSEDMAKVHVQFMPGSKERNQADTYYAIFRQWKKGVEKDGTPYYLLVDGGSLTFVIKILADGKPTLMATEGRLYPGVSPEVMTVNFTEAQMLALAAKRMESPPDALPGQLRKILAKAWDLIRSAVGRSAAPKAPVYLTRQLTNVDGTWRALNLYQATDLKGRPVIVAVDGKSGEAFAWSAQQLLRDGGPIASGVAGAITARGTTLNAAGSDHGPVAPMPLPFADVVGEDGKVVARTAADGTFTVPGAGSTPVKLTISLDGAYAKTSDEDAAKNGPVAVTLTATPGSAVKATLNATGDSEELAAEVNGYVYYSKQVDWLKNAAGLTDERILAPLGGGVKANRHDMPGNAYYSPADDSLNLQAAATVKGKTKDGKVVTMSFENTAQPSIIYHESTHRAVQILSQLALTAKQAASDAFRFVSFVMDPVMDGGVNEAIADTVSMFMRGNPVIGEGFFVTPRPGKPNYIRTGENDTVLDPKNPDPHAQGEAFMGFTWTVRQGLIQALGEAAGAAYAALLVVPTTLYSQPKDVPTAMLHVLLGDMTVDGKLPNEALIREAAKAHGPELPAIPTK